MSKVINRKIAMSALALTLTGAQLMSSVGTVFAESRKVTDDNGNVTMGDGQSSITINGNYSQTLIGKSFNVYKLFFAENSKFHESINYTLNPTYTKALKEIVGEKLGKNDPTEYEIIDYIQSLNHNVVIGADTNQNVEGSYSDYRVFIEKLRDIMTRDGLAPDTVTVTSVANNNSFTIKGLDSGYYLIDEVTASAGTHQANSLCMVETANDKNVQINIKSDYPSVIKKILEDDGTYGWNDIADFEIGQTVPYKYTTRMPNANGYDTYYMAFHDVMDESLGFNKDSVKVKVSDGTKDYYLTADEFKVVENEDGETFKIEVEDMKAIIDREFDQINDLKENIYGQDITVEYNATLLDSAAKRTGRAGFENKVRLEFSNDADSDSKGDNGKGPTGYTPWDSVVCFTYQLDGIKVNNYNLELQGAKFRLYSDKDCTEEVYVKETDDGYIVINRDSVGGSDHVGGTAPAEAVEMVSNDKGIFNIYGLDGGTYYLKETEAPAGYRRILDPIVLTVTPTFTDDRQNYVEGESATDKTLASLDATAYIKQFLSGLFTDSTQDLETDVASGTVNLTVVNKVGSKLPKTGSIMTVVSLASGTALCMFAKKKKKDEE